MDIHKIPLFAAFAVLMGVFLVVLSTPGSGESDFIAYWSATRLLVSGGNPYDPVALHALEHEMRPERAQDRGQAFASWNPPWLLVILLPIGLLPFDMAVHVWMLCNIVLIVVAAAFTWRLLTGRMDRQSVLVVAIASLWFGQSWVTILLGQVSSLLLLGLVMGAWWLNSGRDRLAGVALFLATIKPQVTYFVLLLLMLWVIRHRRWQVLLGMFAAGLISAAILWLFFPGWIAAYLSLIRTYRSLFFQYPAATVGGLAYTLWGTHAFRFAGILLLPFTFTVLRLADSRGWLTAMNTALLISVPLAMYGFNCDQVLMIPVIVQMIAWLQRRELSGLSAWAVGTWLVIIYVALFAMLAVRPLYHRNLFACIPLALAGLYALAWRQRSEMQKVTVV